MSFYEISQAKVAELGDALVAYYDDAWHKGILDRLAEAGAAQNGLLPGYLDMAMDRYNGLKAKSADKFGVTFKSQLRMSVNLYIVNNKHDVASLLVKGAEKAIASLATKIPIPLLGGVLNKAAGAIGQTVRAELQEQSVIEADKRLANKANAKLDRIFTNDAEAAEFVTKSIEQYKLIGQYIQTLPVTLNSFDDVVTFPAAVFKVQAAASSLNVALVQIRDYLRAMEDRLAHVKTVSDDYIRRVRQDMTEAVSAVLQNAYWTACQQAEADMAAGKYTAPRQPVFQAPPPDKTGGATQLAAYLAHAVAMGYYNAGGPSMTRARSGAVIGNRPPMPGMATAAVPPAPPAVAPRTPPPLPPRPIPRKP